MYDTYGETSSRHLLAETARPEPQILDRKLSQLFHYRHRAAYFAYGNSRQLKRVGSNTS